MKLGWQDLWDKKSLITKKDYLYTGISIGAMCLGRKNILSGVSHSQGQSDMYTCITNVNFKYQYVTIWTNSNHFL